MATENRRMRILQLALEYPPNLRGGLGRHVHDLAHSLTVNDCEVGVVVPGHSFKDGSVQVLSADIPKNSLPEDNDLPLLAALNLELAGGLFKAFTAGRWNLLHVHDWMTAPAACLARHTMGVPIVTTIHADISEGRLAWEKPLINVSSKLIVHSHHMREIVEERYPGRKVKVIPGSVRMEHFARPIGVVRHPKRILFVGRLVPYKGCQELIRAVAILRREHGQDVELLIVGDGFYRKVLEQAVAEHNLTTIVTFAGKLDGEDLVTAYQSAAMVIIPSHREPFGLVGLEAMAAGTPVIASEVGGLAEYIQHGHTGLLTPPQNVEQLVEKINLLLGRPEYGRRLAKKALKEVIPEHSWKHIGQQFRSLYREILP